MPPPEKVPAFADFSPPAASYPNRLSVNDCRRFHKRPRPSGARRGDPGLLEQRVCLVLEAAYRNNGSMFGSLRRTAILGLLALQACFCPARADQLDRYIDDMAKKEITTRVRAAQTIGNFGPAAVRAISVLVKHLDADYEVWQVKEACARSLGRIGAAATGSLPTLRSAMENRRTEVTVAAARAIGDILINPGKDIGEDLRANVQSLLRLANGSEEVRNAAAQSIVQIGPQAAPMILEFLKTNNDQTQNRFAAQIMGDSMDVSLDDAVSSDRLLASADPAVATKFDAAITRSVEKCAAKGIPCLPELPKIEKLLQNERTATPAYAGSGIELSVAHLKLVQSIQNRSFIIKFLDGNWLVVGGVVVVLIWVTTTLTD